MRITREELITVILGLPVCLGTVAVGVLCLRHCAELGWVGLMLGLSFLLFPLFAAGLLLEDRQFRERSQGSFPPRT